MNNKTAIILIAIYVILIRYPTIDSTIEFDTAHRTIFGTQIINGKTPYLETLDNVPPTIPIMWAILNKMSHKLIPVTTIIAITITTTLIYITYSKTTRGLLTSLLYPTIITHKWIINHQNIETYVALALMITIYQITRKSNNSIYTTTILPYIKQTSILTTIILTLRQERKQILKSVILHVIIITILITTSKMTAIQGLLTSNTHRLFNIRITETTAIVAVIMIIYLSTKKPDNLLATVIITETIMLTTQSLNTSWNAIPLIMTAICLATKTIDSIRYPEMIKPINIIMMIILGCMTITTTTGDITPKYHKDSTYETYREISKQIPADTLIFSDDISIYIYAKQQPKGRIIAPAITYMQQTGDYTQYYINETNKYTNVLTTSWFIETNQEQPWLNNTIKILEETHNKKTIKTIKEGEYYLYQKKEER